MISLRARLFIVISLVVLIILGVSLFLLVRSKTITLPSFGAKTPTPTGEQTETAPINNVNQTAGNTVQIAPISSEEAQKKAVQQLARIFYERLNTYSSQSQFQNVNDVKSMVTKSYWKQLSANIPAVNNSVAAPTAEFSSQIAQVYSLKFSAWSDNSATVDIQFKLGQEKNGVTTEKNAEAKVTMVKVGNDWLVDKSALVK